MSDKEPWKKKVDLFRRKFQGREDVFFGSTVAHKSEKDPVTGEDVIVEYRSFAPVCMNYGNKSLCLITQRKGGCSECSNRQLQPVTDAWVYKHINGEADMIIPMLTPQGIKFGAADFDIGDPFEDAKSVRDLSVSCGLPCYIARSTKKGYHVYWFFSEWIPAHYFTSFLRYLFTEAGFYQRQRNDPRMRLPEVFPKQISIADPSKFGNGIKVPMIDPKMRDGFNCWVGDDKIPFPVDKQWTYLENTHDITLAEFEKVLSDKSIEVLRAAASRDAKEARQIEGRGGEGVPHKIVPFGSFEEVILSCPAMGKLWAKNSEGKYLWDISNPNGLFHDARYASMVLALHTKDGEEMLKKRWSSSKTDTYIKQARAAGYTPVTCQWLQEKGICVVGRDPKHHDHCMERMPPRTRDGGKEIINPDNLPPEQWPAPSPIRFATSRHLNADEILEVVHQLAEAKKQQLRAGPPEMDPNTGHPIIKEVYIPENIQDRLLGVVRRIKEFSKDEQKKILDTISAYKLLPTKELNGLMKVADKEAKADAIKKQASGLVSFRDNGETYYMDTERCSYWKEFIDAKGNPMMRQLTNWLVELTSEYKMIRIKEGEAATEESFETLDRQYDGVIRCRSTIQRDGTDEVYESVSRFSGLTMDGWLRGRDHFFKQLAKIAGPNLSWRTADMDDIRTCIFKFNLRVPTKNICEDVGHYLVNGNDVYVSPSVLVTKDEIKHNTLYHIDTQNRKAIETYDFTLLTREEAKELSYHLISDFFYCNVPDIVRPCFAHAMASTMLPQLEKVVHFNRSPILTIAGNISGGKTFIAQKTASFFGANQTGFVITSTGFAIGLLANMYRHSLLVLNDYKKAVAEQQHLNIVDIIQKAYDRDERLAGTRSGGLRSRSTRARGLILMTGEDIPNNESSVISRQIAIEGSPKPDLERGSRVNQMQPKYCGFTPYFIQFLYQMKPSDLEGLWKSYFQAFMAGLADRPMFNSSNRVCENLTVNMVAFHIAMETMVSLGVDSSLTEAQIKAHFNCLEGIREWVLKEVSDTRGSSQFLRLLTGMIQDSGRFKIDGWPYGVYNASSSSARLIGFYQQTEPGVLFLIPEASMSSAKELGARADIMLQSTSHTAKQLREDGILEERLLRDGEKSCMRRGPGGSPVRVWPIRLAALGIEYGRGGNSENVVNLDQVEKRSVK